jgi:signal-transduction protein with cAMP-binding, CBS, and nucleotidyltransferase domain
MNAGGKPDNHLSPSELSPLARQNLKAAFSQIRTSQAALLNRFHLA